SRYYRTVINAGFYVTPNAIVFGEFTYSKYDEGKGGTQTIDKNSGDYVSIGGDAAGISNKN
ncbi:omptin family outer membrane protease, partial [Yersinia pestis]|uniref:omptin family outer membrane protease n=1 Tax=Yersinia pestis TaxID=632 RepID=UPI001C448B07